MIIGIDLGTSNSLAAVYMDGEVKFKISGKELIGVLNNYNRKTEKVK